VQFSAAKRDTMNWKHPIKRNLLFAVLGAVTANVLYLGLLFTKSLHGFAVKALGPAIEIVYQLDPTYSVSSRYRFCEEFAVSILLYSFWIFMVLMVISLLGRAKQRFRSV
jgi:hypothetical protein